MRFQKQRMKDAADNRFQLPDEDGEDGGEALTHMGRSLSEFDDFPGPAPTPSITSAAFFSMVKAAAWSSCT